MKKHGLHTRAKPHPLFRVWCEMRYRCNNPDKHNYRHYGGRGIRVCKRWENFANFVKDMSPRPPGTTLDRRNKNGNYTPKNCRWATRLEQANNTRVNRILRVGREARSLSEWGRITGIDFRLIHARIDKLGWSVRKAITTPVRRTRSY